MKLWQAIISFDDYESTVLTADSFEAAKQRLYEWVKMSWAEEFPHDGMPDDPYNAVNAYFEWMDGEEGSEIVEVEVPFPVAKVVYDRAAYKELTDVLGLEPFPFYNYDGGPHWAVYTEVAYRLDCIFNADVPALRKLLTPLGEAEVHAVIVVDEG